MNTVPVDASPTYLTSCAKARGAILYPERTKGSERKPKVPY